MALSAYTNCIYSYKTLGITLALCSGVFIGMSFVMKKKGLLAANLKDGKEAGEGYGYLKNWWWWGGMTLSMITHHPQSLPELAAKFPCGI